MRGDMGSLYDAHADRLYAYCWSLVGDRLASAGVGDTFTAAVHHPPRGDRVLWLYSLARTACAERGAFTGTGPRGGPGGAPLFSGSDPLLRAAAGLRTDHREVLLLWAGEWLEPHDIALVLGIAPDTVAQLLNAARTRLERSVLDTLMRGTSEPRLDLISAFEKGRLPQLLARRAPSGAPAWLRERVLAACEEEAARPLPSIVTPSPLVAISAEKARSAAGRPRGGADAPRRGPAGAMSKGLGAAAGVAASAAAVVGLLATWSSGKEGGSTSLVPTASNAQTNPASMSSGPAPQHPVPGLTGTERVASPPDTAALHANADPRRDRGVPGATTSASPTASPSTSPS
ncbi:sigma-70 family RNA polymerase sigma factor, partial [Actinomadura sp. KC216]|uniref:RNA polymerase sigma factor n=1 Tax=Actinomadura sp. KC216 TaxID=2530370 RepID=UPI001404C9EA